MTQQMTSTSAETTGITEGLKKTCIMLTRHTARMMRIGRRTWIIRRLNQHGLI